LKREPLLRSKTVETYPATLAVTLGKEKRVGSTDLVAVTDFEVESAAADNVVVHEPAPAPAGSRSSTVADDADEMFLRSLYASYAAPLLSSVMRFTGGDRHWAEDVVQETVVRAWRHRDRLLRENNSRSLLPWLVTVARRIVINNRRGRNARPMEVDGAFLALITVPDDTDRALERAIVARALAALRPAHRKVLVEVYLRDRTVVEVARMIGVPEGTVKSRMFHGLRCMRTALRDQGVSI
jgi:RNA polymerase sigma-70 factor, ECF subfamily